MQWKLSWLTKKESPPTRTMWWERDEPYNSLFAKGLELTGSNDGNLHLAPKLRFYDLIQLYCATFHLEGETAEAGCLSGLSSFLMCGYARLNDSSFSGEGHHLFDSFVGLSDPTPKDIQKEIINPHIEKVLTSSNKAKRGRGTYLESTKKTLSEFPDVQYNLGWIPEVFANVRDRSYRFVHIDVNLYEPTCASREYFCPRLVSGGIMVCDDYGFVSWPGAKAAVDEYCNPQDIPLIRLTSGSAAIIKR